jgi:hypothetical protein
VIGTFVPVALHGLLRKPRWPWTADMDPAPGRACLMYPQRFGQTQPAVRFASDSVEFRDVRLCRLAPQITDIRELALHVRFGPAGDVGH